jgi:mannose-1-phosphate guanylyltransferase
MDRWIPDGRGAMTDDGRRWAVILAGGDGTRLRPLTRELAGDDRPKQYCRVLGGETLLDQTRQRVSRSVSPLRTLIVVTRHHERFYRDGLADLLPRALVVQPENRGTAAGILYPLLRLETRTPSDVVALFPSDHYISDDETFMVHVDAAFDAVRACPDRTVLLGVRPDRAETEYGWIEPGPPVIRLARPWPMLVSGVRRFWEKPRPKLAAALEARGCLWNSFVIVARVSALVGLVRQALPAVSSTLAAARPAFDGPDAAAAAATAYAALPTADFSREVLAVRPERLGVLPVSGVTWNDLGDPARVFATRRHVERWASLTRPMAVGQ